MARPRAIPDAGPLIRWSVKTTSRARDKLVALADENGMSVGRYLDALMFSERPTPEPKAKPAAKPPAPVKRDGCEHDLKSLPAIPGVKQCSKCEARFRDGLALPA